MGADQYLGTFHNLLLIEAGVVLQGLRPERTLPQRAAGSVHRRSCDHRRTGCRHAVLHQRELSEDENHLLELLISASGSLGEPHQEVVRSGDSELPLHVVQNSLLHGKNLLAAECFICYGDEIVNSGAQISSYLLAINIAAMPTSWNSLLGTG